MPFLPIAWTWMLALFAALLRVLALLSLPPPVPVPAPVSVPVGRVLALPVIAQVYNLSCEAASLQMALAYEGVHADQPALVALMRPDYAAAEVSGGRVVGWSDPYVNFVGDPSGHEYDHTGYGVYYPVVARVAAAEGRPASWSGTGLSWERLTAFIVHGHPVVAWVAFDGSRYGGGPLYEYAAWDGRRVPFGPGFEHAVALSGIRPDAVLVANPRWGYREWLPKPEFLAAFAVFGAMAVVL